MPALNPDVAVYVAPNAPPAAPDSLVRGHLAEQFRAGSEANEGDRTWKWTAILDVPLGTDIRDNYPGLPQQTVYVTATVSLGAGCPYLSGVEVTLTHNAITNLWEGTKTDACAGVFDGPFDLTVIVECDPAGCGAGWKLMMTLEDHGTAADVCVDPGCSCVPLGLTFSGIVFPMQGAECDGGVQIIVTE